MIKKTTHQKKKRSIKRKKKKEMGREKGMKEGRERGKKKLLGLVEFNCRNCFASISFWSCCHGFSH